MNHSKHHTQTTVFALFDIYVYHRSVGHRVTGSGFRSLGTESTFRSLGQVFGHQSGFGSLGQVLGHQVLGQLSGHWVRLWVTVSDGVLQPK